MASFSLIESFVISVPVNSHHRPSERESFFCISQVNHHIELKPLSILSEEMDSIKDTLKNCKSIKNSDEILDELFSSIKVRYMQLFNNVQFTQIFISSGREKV